MSATNTVLSNPDLLHNICGLLNRTDIQQARQVNRDLEAAASPFLFRTLTIGLRKRYIRRLQHIAETPKFAKGVRDVVWETLHYASIPEDAPDDEKYDSYDILRLLNQVDHAQKHEAEDMDYLYCPEPEEDEVESFESERKALIHRYQRLRADEFLLSRTAATSVGPPLAKAFEAFTGLKSVSVTSWAKKAEERCFFDPGAFSGTGKTMPTPVLALYDPDTASKMQNIALRVLLYAMMVSKRQVRRFDIAPTSSSVLAPLARQYVMPPMRMDTRGIFSAPAPGEPDVQQQMAYALGKLKEFHLDEYSAVEHGGCLERLKAVVRYCKGLPAFFALSQGLEAVSLRVHAEYPGRRGISTTVIPLSKILGEAALLPRLKSLRLRDLWLEAGELCEALKRHGATLEEVELRDVNLGETTVLSQTSESVVIVEDPKFRTNHAFEAGVVPDWAAVVQACAALPKLRGLKIDGPSVGVDWSALSLWQAEELEELGMDGRKNCLVPEGSWNVLSLLYV